jgi:hypothetical protein
MQFFVTFPLPVTLPNILAALKMYRNRYRFAWIPMETFFDGRKNEGTDKSAI